MAEKKAALNKVAEVKQVSLDDFKGMKVRMTQAQPACSNQPVQLQVINLQDWECSWQAWLRMGCHNLISS
jgi:hypothetical protein